MVCVFVFDFVCVCVCVCLYLCVSLCMPAHVGVRKTCQHLSPKWQRLVCGPPVHLQSYFSTGIWGVTFGRVLYLGCCLPWLAWCQSHTPVMPSRDNTLRIRHCQWLESLNVGCRQSTGIWATVEHMLSRWWWWQNWKRRGQVLFKTDRCSQ